MLHAGSLRHSNLCATLGQLYPPGDFSFVYSIFYACALLCTAKDTLTYTSLLNTDLNTDYVNGAWKKMAVVYGHVCSYTCVCLGHWRVSKPFSGSLEGILALFWVTGPYLDPFLGRWRVFAPISGLLEGIWTLFCPWGVA